MLGRPYDLLKQLDTQTKHESVPNSTKGRCRNAPGRPSLQVQIAAIWIHSLLRLPLGCAGTLSPKQACRRDLRAAWLLVDQPEIDPKVTTIRRSVSQRIAAHRPASLLALQGPAQLLALAIM